MILNFSIFYNVYPLASIHQLIYFGIANTKEMNQQQPFFFSAFLFFNLFDGTSIGIKLTKIIVTSIPVYFPLKLKRSFKMLYQLPVCFWHL